MTNRTRWQGKKQVEEVESVPFMDGQEAWFWFTRCQVMREEGARVVGGLVETPRPCMPDDIYRAVMGLYRNKVIFASHLKVLGSYGLKLTPPDERDFEERSDARLWEDALYALGEVLKKKGLVV